MEPAKGTVSANPILAMLLKTPTITSSRRSASRAYIISVLFFAAASATSAQTVWDGLVSFYPFDDGSGTTVTDIIGGADGTLVNFSGSPWTTANLGGALTFNGSAGNTCRSWTRLRP